MAHTKVSNSSWISGITYSRGFLAIWTLEGSALLYKDVPSYIPGLLISGSVGKGKGRSIGRAYVHYVKGEANYGPCQTLKTEEAKKRLKELFAELEIAIKRERKEKKRKTPAQTPKFRVVNIDRMNTLPSGSVETENDRACVLSTTETEKHPITGKDQPKMVYGVCTVRECSEWISKQDLNKLYLDTRY